VPTLVAVTLRDPDFSFVPVKALRRGGYVVVEPEVASILVTERKGRRKGLVVLPLDPHFGGVRSVLTRSTTPTAVLVAVHEVAKLNPRPGPGSSWRLGLKW